MNVNIIDNAIPAVAVKGLNDAKPLGFEVLQRLLDEVGDWDEPSLKRLVTELLGETDWIDVRGYTNPEFFFADEKRVQEDEGGMVLLDWDTGMDGVTALRETLKTRPNDGVFIITGFDTSSRVSEQVFENFGAFSKRIEICRKGEGESFSFLRMVGKLYEMVEGGVVVAKHLLKTSQDATPPKEDGLCRVSYATNRKLSKEDPVQYGNDREAGLDYGFSYARVTPRASIQSNWKIARCFALGKPRSHFVSAERLQRADFFEHLNRLGEVSADSSEFILFVHGFNVPFVQAVESIAQIAFDIRFPGQVGVFSWPSLGDQSKNGYMTDKETATGSTKALASFILELSSQTKISRIHILAHSMGNFLLLHALDQLLMGGGERLKERLGQVVLVAADVEATWFLERHFASLTDRVTVYCTNNDWALALAQEYQTHGRLGLIPPVTCGKDCDTVDASVCRTPFSGVGHDYYAGSSRLLADLTLVLQGHPIDKRPAVRPLKGEAGSYWALEAVQ